MFGVGVGVPVGTAVGTWAVCVTATGRVAVAWVLAALMSVVGAGVVAGAQETRIAVIRQSGKEYDLSSTDCLVSKR